jgi:hypothetical protein
LTVSTAKSFQPFATSAATSNTSAGQLLVDWTERVVPVSRISAKDDESAAYEKRKEEWARRYTNLENLRETFGSNQNKLWGDLDPSTARRLYRYLMPTALIQLVKVGVQPQDLAPLAYEARVAAKLYARERSIVPVRIAAVLYDGIRQLKRYGRFQSHGMTYDQVWEKYHKVIMDDSEDNICDDLCEQDVTAKICLKILERSCSTNESIDRWVLPTDDDKEQREDLTRMANTLEMDVRKLLDPFSDDEPQKLLSLRQYRTLRLVARIRGRVRRSSSTKTNEDS